MPVDIIPGMVHVGAEAVCFVLSTHGTVHRGARLIFCYKSHTVRYSMLMGTIKDELSTVLYTAHL